MCDLCLDVNDVRLQCLFLVCVFFSVLFCEVDIYANAKNESKNTMIPALGRGCA